jgi:type II secretion system protein J
MTHGNHRQSGTAGSAGFTLVEVLIALVVVGVMGTAIYGTVKVGNDASRKAERYADLMQMAREMTEMIAADLSAAISTGAAFDPGFIGTDGAASGLSCDSVSFVALCNNPCEGTVNEIDLAYLSYSMLADGIQPKGLQRSRTRLLTALYPDQADVTDKRTVLGEAIGLNLRYFDGTSWTETWDSTQSETMPRSVEITIYIADEGRKDNYRTFTTEVALAIEKPKKK